MMLAARVPVRARSHTVPAPTGGWNASSALDDMPKDEAVTLINWFPETTYCRLRSGFQTHSDTTTAAPVTALATYSSGTADDLLAYSDGAWYDVTTSTPALLATVGTNEYWTTTNYATAAGQYLIAVNGDATPQVYDGATMVAAVNTIGGAPPAISFSSVCSFNNRLYYAETNSLSIWYLPVGQYQGALTEYDLGPLATQGGEIVAIQTWTRDNASAGANEMFVAVTDQGEVFIFTGLYPGGAWNISARFVVGRPVAGPNCLIRLGPDLVLMCEDGFQPLGQYLQLGQSQAQRVALSAKIGNAVTAAVRNYGTLDGWCATLYPARNMLLFNVPQGSDVYVQYVVNTLTGAWGQYQGMNGPAWACLNGSMYFGGLDGVVYLAEAGTSDNGAAINAEWLGSYQYAGGRGAMKRFTMARPIFQTTGAVTVRMDVDVDFVNTDIGAATLSTSTAGVWGTSIWGFFAWGGAYQLQRDWISVSGLGYAVAPHMKVSTTTISMNLMATDILWESGGFL